MISHAEVADWFLQRPLCQQAQPTRACRYRHKPQHNAAQGLVQREAPASEAELDNTVRTLTEQRLSDGLATGVSSIPSAYMCLHALQALHAFKMPAKLEHVIAL